MSQILISPTLPDDAACAEISATQNTICRGWNLRGPSDDSSDPGSEFDHEDPASLFDCESGLSAWDQLGEAYEKDAAKVGM